MSERRNQYDQPVGPAVAGWTERPRPPRRTLHGRCCRLEPVDSQRHAADLFRAYMDAPDARDWTYLYSERPESFPLFEEYLAKLADSEDPLHYTIVDVAAAKAVGTAALMRIDPAHGVIEVGSIAYSPRIKRTRAGTEAMYLLMRLVFDDLGYRRYEGKCDSLNGPRGQPRSATDLHSKDYSERRSSTKVEAAIPRGTRSLRRNGRAYDRRSMPGSTPRTSTSTVSKSAPSRRCGLRSEAAPAARTAGARRRLARRRPASLT